VQTAADDDSERPTATPIESAADDSVGEERYRRLVDHSPDAICVHEYGRLLYVNPAGVNWMAATSSDQLVGRQITQFVRPDSIPAMLARISALQNEGDCSEPSEAVLLRLDGTFLDVEAVSVLTMWDGRPAHQVVFRDVTAQKAAQATLRYQAALVNHVSDALIATTSEGIVTSWNPAAEQIYGRASEHALGLPVHEAVGADLDPTGIVADGGVQHAIHRGTDSAPLAVRVSAAAMEDGYVLVCSDQTALRRAEQHFQTIVSSLDEGIVVLSRQGAVESINPAALRILGLDHDTPKHDAFRHAADYLVYDADGRPMPPDERPLFATLKTGTPIQHMVAGVDRPDGRRLWLSASCRLLNPEDVAHSALLISFSDITAQHNASTQLAYLANHDTLTGLPNRAQLVARVADGLDSNTEPPLAAVMFIDLNDLKAINDSLGHEAGDQLITVAAHRLRDGLRSGDVVGRLGGDEFVALVFGRIDRTALHDLAARLHAILAEPVSVGGISRGIAASIGVTEIHPNDPRDAAAILRDADRAMYRAKAAGTATGFA
jgi:diguanylate cyclase (GGDEF)-like protein/PAS domain S-box-containing protein